MLNRKFGIGLIAAAILLGGCTRIPTGYVGVRTDISKQIVATELQEGSWNQIIVGEVDKVGFRELYGQVINQRPQVKDNIALDDADVVYTYNLNPQMVAEVLSTKPKTWHHVEEKSGEINLMRIYMDQLFRNALFNAVRTYDVKTINDHRAEIEQKIRQLVNSQLEEDKNQTFVSVSTVTVQSLTPPKNLMESYAAVVRSANDVEVKKNEVRVAEEEAKRMQKLSENSKQSIDYMNAQANMAIAEGIKNGKVNTVVVPFDFKGMVNVGK